MDKIATLTGPDTLQLPAEVAERFRPDDRFLVWAEGDTLYLKRITSPDVLNRVAERPDEKPLSLEEINDVVHEVRRQRKSE
jgi:hypothetical protein